MKSVVILSSAMLAASIGATMLAQGVQPGAVAAAVGAERSSEPVLLTFANRPIVTLRARVLGRQPAERAEGARRMLDDLIAQGVSGPVESRPFDGGSVVMVASRGVLALTSPDIDELADETLERVSAQVVERLRLALSEASEARSPGRLLVSAALAAVGLVAGLLILLGLLQARERLANRLVAIAEQKLASTGLTDLTALRSSRVLEFERGLVTAITVGLSLIVAYSTITFILRRFPYTRPWGEAMRSYLLTTLGDLAMGAVRAIPGLFTIALIAVVTSFIIRLLGLWFNAVERGRTHVRWLYPETAQPTRRLATALLWLLAIVVAYPYMPGSQSDAFRGITVFLGLMVTFGSAGLMNQIMSGFMLTYSRALRLGDFVRIGDIEGTVLHLGVLSTKLKTLRGEEATIPNAVVVAQTTTDYSRFAESSPVYMPTSVTIGYDVPWRQVQALLLQAADRTPGIHRDPQPVVLQLALEDFYVKYTLFFCLERQDQRAFVLNALHGQIQDLFNEYGVQIMSPNYVLDPKTRKVVEKKDWFAAPARPDERAAGSAGYPKSEPPSRLDIPER